MAKAPQKTVKILSNPLVIKFLTWLAPIVLSFVMNKITKKRKATGNQSATSNGRKHLKNKAD